MAKVFPRLRGRRSRWDVIGRYFVTFLLAKMLLLRYNTYMNTLQKQSLFWDVDLDTLDPEEHASYIIERVLDFGDDEDIRWLFSMYPKVAIKGVLENSRSTIHAKSKALWTLVLQ